MEGSESRFAAPRLLQGTPPPYPEFVKVFILKELIVKYS
jgi:hypothetical protein